MTLSHIELDELVAWKRKRCKTYMVYLLQCVLNGLETSMIATVLWVYMKTEVEGNQKKLFYCLTCGAFNLPPILFNIVISRWVDKTRQARMVIIICNSISAIGKLLFIIPFSSYYVLFGRFLSGFKGTLRPIMVAEMARSYASEDLQSKLPLFAVFSLLGYASGPLVTFAFTDVDLLIGSLHVTWGNSCSFVLLVFTIVQIVLAFVFVHDLSLEYDLKENETILKDEQAGSEHKQAGLETNKLGPVINKVRLESNNFGPDSKQVGLVSNNLGPDSTKPDLKELYEEKANTKESSIKVMQKIFMNVDISSMLILTCIGEFWNSAFYHAIPYIIIDVMKRTGNELGLFFTAYGLVVFVMVLSVSRMRVTNSCVLYIGGASFVSLGVVGVCYYNVSPTSPVFANSLLLIIFCFFFSFFQLGEKIFLITCLAKMLYSDNQGVGESLRYTFKKVGTITGSLLTLYVFDYFKYCFVVLVPTICIILCFLVVRRKVLSNPQPLV